MASSQQVDKAVNDAKQSITKAKSVISRVKDKPKNLKNVLKKIETEKLPT